MTYTPDSLRELIAKGPWCETELLKPYADAWQLLIDAVNDSCGECLPECDSFGHAEGCEYVDVAAWLTKLQAANAALRERLEVDTRFEYARDQIRNAFALCLPSGESVVYCASALVESIAALASQPPVTQSGADADLRDTE